MNEQQHVPLFKKWRYWYILLVAVLLGLIIFFTWFTKYFS